MTKDFADVKLLVVGDVMLDQYWNGKAERISPEAPVPVVKVNSDEIRAGGAANVALNVAALGAKVHLLGVVGADLSAEQLNQTLAHPNISYDWVISPNGTICKLRVLSHHQQLIRMDFEKPVAPETAKELADLLAKQVADYDILIISDYAKGALQFVEQMIAAARAAKVPVLIDPKGDDFTRYQGATLIKPNQSEFERIVGACTCEPDLVAKANQLIAKLNLEGLLVTRSENGVALMLQDKEPYMLKSQAQEVFDVTGAGDTVIATLATAKAAGLSWQNAVHMANTAASIVVRKVGTSTVTKAELDQALIKSSSHKGYVAPSEDELCELIAAAKAAGEKVVFTNGCFDLLHSGHVRYLNQAAKLGERLIIAVNSDESVAGLKGDLRPIVPLASRMELLASLSCVDWVIPFAEDTPERLICKLLPDVLVKGGDYKPEQIAGAKCVLANGGDVKVLAFWDGFSTTNIIEKIKIAEGEE